MAYKITDACIGCGSCQGNCPCDAIDANGDVYAIDADKCAGCGACQDGCPVDAIVEE